MNTSFKYRAFISYSHSDESWAKGEARGGVMQRFLLLPLPAMLALFGCTDLSQHHSRAES